MNDELTTYRIERCEHDIDKHPNAIVMGGHFVGRLEEHLPNCDGSRLVPVEPDYEAVARKWSLHPKHVKAIVVDALGGADE